ncbi:acylphosphatase [Candidatus Bathyarchaeota archaeon]|nr:acylphosphatase [Candidatus Bathyarchaeota archaeon]
MIRAHIYISGRVQGVGFRASTRRKANQLNVKGWVRNLRDGRVEVLAEGKEEDIDNLINWCHHGPTMANVRDLKVEKTEPTGEFSGFTTKRGTH